ncbi:MAG TPA: EAL domain-containing protein [Rhodocyclaceae bacterium]|nr:EAL domain-containing protein [Rhodocyclaceae bacterium]
MTSGLTDTNELTARLRNSEAMRQAACSIGHFGAWAYALNGGQLVWSDEVCAIHEVDVNYTPDLDGAIAFYHPDDRERIARMFADCRDHGIAFDDEFTLITARGNERRVRSMGRAVCNVDARIEWIEGGIQDVTEQYRRQRRLAESEATLAAIFKQSYLFKALLDSQGRLLEANPVAYDACGYRPDEETGCLFWECSWWHGDIDVADKVRDIVMRVLAGEIVTDEIDYFVADGERRHILLSAVPIQTDGGKTRRALISGMDITARVRNQTFYNALRGVLEKIARLRPLPETLLDILRLIENQFPRKLSTINLLTADGLTISHGYSNSLPASYLRLLEGLNIGPKAGSCGTAAFERETVVVSDIQSDARWDAYRALAEPYGLRSCWSMPIFDARGRVLGTFAIYGYEPSMPSPDELALVADCAHIAGIAIERAQADAQLREQASLLDKAHDAIIVRALDHRILFWNRGAERLYGWSPDEVVGLHINQLLYADTSGFEDGTRRVLEHGEWLGELEQITKSGQSIWVEAHWSLVRDDEGRPRSILAINTDISERKASEREIYTLAFHDSLTGLPNRQLLQNRLGQALSAADRSHANGAILFIDLDNFKSLNDTQGHDVGDKLLVQVAQRLNLCVRESDTVARIGGDEFVVMLGDLGQSRTDAANQAQHVARNIMQAFVAPFDLDGYECSSTPSIGIAMFSDAQLGVDELLKRADLAMYQSKAEGRNTSRFFDPEMQAAVLLRVQMEKDLRRAISQGEFVLYYQPQINAMGCLIGAEALIRWQHPEHGLVSPFNFIPVAESSGMILPIGAWVLETACRQLALWAQQPACAALSIAVNVSAHQLQHPDFVAQIGAALAQSGANPCRLKLELTESLLLENIEETIDKMHALQRLGVRFSLDDFGTGYSSLSYLKRLPLAQLKIDPSFVRDIMSNASDAAIVRTVIALGQSLGLEVIAEGVENQAQRELLLSLGCTCYQGYLFSRPLPIEQFKQLEFKSTSMCAGDAPA